MTAFIDENQQFIDPDTSAPIVNGDVFFGEQGADPETVPITVFVDRGLTTPISQPVKTDASGRTTQKIFIPGRYSFKVLNSAAVQKLIDLDAGSIEAVGTTVLTNITGGNTITASADPVLTALVNGEQFTFTAVAINTDDMTLDIDGLGAKSILFNFAEQMAPGFIQQDQTVNLTYNSTEDAFFWGNEGRGISILTNVDIVIGTDPNTITADGGPSVTGNVDNQLYSFKVDTTNDDKVTLKIGNLTAVAIKNKGADLLPGQLLANIIYIVSFLPGSPDTFEVVSGIPLSSPGPVGNTNPNSVDSTVLTASNSIQVASGATITTLGDTATLDGSDVKVPTNLTVQEAIAAATSSLLTKSGVIIQVQTTQSSAKVFGNAGIPSDDTIPQITEGFEVMTRTFTPKFSDSKIIIQAKIMVNYDVEGSFTAAIFKDSIANALAAEGNNFVISGGSPIDTPIAFSFQAEESAGSISARTYRVRIGANAAGGTRTATFNGVNNLGLYGTAPKSSITVLEIGV